MYNINIFTIISGISFLFAAFFALFSIFTNPYRKSTASFVIFSAITAIISLSTFFILITNEVESSEIWGYVSLLGALMFPPALFIFISNFLEYRISRVNKFLKTLLYLPPLVIFILLIADGNIAIVRGEYGYVVSIPYMMMIGILYMAPYLLLTISLIGLNIYQRRKRNWSNLSGNLLLVGVIIFTLGMFTLKPIETLLGLEIPVNTIFMALLYFFISLSVLSVKANINNMTLKQVFSFTSDCIIITDPGGKTISINKHMEDVLFGNDRAGRSSLKDLTIKHKMLNATKDKDKMQKLFNRLNSSSIEDFNMDISCNIGNQKKTYNVRVSPVLNNKNMILARIAVFRDITNQIILQERLRQEAIRDCLTDAYNRRYFFEQLDREVKRYHRYRNPFSLMMIDIDGFKKFNDTYGHLKGDWLLKETVDVFNGSIRQGIDIVTRYGGDEFTVLLLNSDIERAKRIANRIIGYFNKKDVKETSLSIGICQYSEEMEVKDLINCSDALMYEAKIDEGNSIKVPT